MRPMTAIEGLFHGVLREILMTGVVVLLTVVCAIIVVLAVTTGTLSNLKKGALAISGGNYGIRVKANAWDETGDIAKAFNAMASSVESSIDSISAVSDGYGRFVSDKLIDILGKKSITRIAAGDIYAKITSHLLLYTDSFEGMQNDEFFDAIGEFYSTVISDISNGDGLIARQSANGVSVIFECLPQDTLQTIFCIQSALDKLQMNVDCYAFLGYSSIVLGVTGNDQYLNTITVSHLSYEYKSIGLLGKRFSARLIVSADAYDKMGESTQQYRHRLLGYSTEKGEIKPLYDFYDCDCPEIRLKKEETKVKFELGVRLYYEKEFNKARTIFVDIIKIFPQDTASREYLLMSHMARENDNAPKCLIEV
jgi:HAMP domain-containing protein